MLEKLLYMNSWSHLLSLLSGLSKSEKRHFKMLTSLQGGEKKYLALFGELEKIAAQTDPATFWDDDQETRLKYRLQRKGLTGPLSALRQYLTGLLLKSLRLQEEYRTPGDEARRLLQEAVLLQRRGLYEPAIERCEQTLLIASDYELFDLEVEALTQLCYLRSQQNLKNYRETQEGLCRRLESAATRLYTEARYRALHYQVFALTRLQANPDAPGIADLLQHYETDELLTSNPDNLAFQARVYYHTTHAHLAYARRSKANAKHHHEAIVQLWERHPRQIEEKTRNYIIALANYINLCISSGDIVAAKTYLGKLKAVEPVFYDDRAEAFQNIALAEQLYLLNAARLDEAEAFIPYLEQGLTIYRNKVNRAREIVLRNNILTTYFANGNYAAALEYTQIMAGLGRSEHRVDIQSMVGIWRLIFHYELRHDKYLEQLVKNISQNLRDSERLFDFERLVMRHMYQLVQIRVRHLPESEEKTATLAAFLTFRDALADFSAKLAGVKLLGLEEVSLWVESHCSDKSIADLLRERRQASA